MFYSDNFGGNLNFVSRHELFGLRNILTIGLSPHYENEPRQNYENLFGHTGATTARAVGSSINAPAYLEDQLYLAPRLSILAGAQAIFADRHFVDEFLTDAEGNQSTDTGIHEFQSQLAAAFVRQSGRVHARSGFQPGLHTASIATCLDHRSRNPRRVFAVSVGVVALSLVGSE